jgi:hypothetical protein
MTDPGALAEQRLGMSGFPADDVDAAGDQVVWDDYPDDARYLDDGYLQDEWAAVPPAPAPAPSAPWFRNPRLLFGLIAVAAAALVVASVLLITSRQSGEIPTTAQLTTRATPSGPAERSNPQPSSEPASASATSSSSSSEASSSESVQTAEPEAPARQAVVPSATAAPPAPEQTISPAGPNLNVTRTPMSFSPSKH